MASDYGWNEDRRPFGRGGDDAHQDTEQRFGARQGGDADGRLGGRGRLGGDDAYGADVRGGRDRQGESAPGHWDDGSGPRDRGYGADTYGGQRFGGRDRGEAGYGNQGYGATGYGYPGSGGQDYGARAYGSQVYGSDGWGVSGRQGAGGRNERGYAGQGWSRDRAFGEDRSFSPYSSDAAGDGSSSTRGETGAAGFGREDRVRGAAADPGAHRGRGPKGYTRSDERIREDVNDVLTDDAQLDATHVTAEVSGAEVTLTGHVASRRDKRRAEDLVDQISGVKHVQNNLRVHDSNYNAATATAGGPASAGPTDTAGQGASAAGRVTGRA